HLAESSCDRLEYLRQVAADLPSNEHGRERGVDLATSDATGHHEERLLQAAPETHFFYRELDLLFYRIGDELFERDKGVGETWRRLETIGECHDEAIELLLDCHDALHPQSLDVERWGGDRSKNEEVPIGDEDQKVDREDAEHYEKLPHSDVITTRP